MSSAATRRRSDNSLIALLVLSTPLVGTLAVAGLLYVGLRVQQPEPPPELPHDDTRCVLVPEEQAERPDSWQRDLYDWAWLLDPTLLVLPDEVRGFSKVRGRDLNVLPADVPAYAFELSPEEEQKVPPVDLPRTDIPYSKKIVQSWVQSRPPPAEPFLIVPFARGVFWRFHDGRLLEKPPELSLDDITEALDEEGFPKYPTTLRVARPEAAQTARVTVVRSCGNRALDRLALAAVRSAVGRYELIQRGGVTADQSRPEYVPPPGGYAEFEIEWSVPVEPTL